MKRRAFAALAAGYLSLPRTARASGGLDDSDLDAARVSGDSVRLLLAQGVAADEGPRRIDAQTFRFRGKRYRGSFALLPGPNDTSYAVVNLVPFEAYLRGVVGAEIPASWPAAALEAQAIVARGFARSRRKNMRAYDLVTSEVDQAYGGRDTEHAATTAATLRTADILVFYDGAPASVYFMSCCGGHTVDASSVWGGHAGPYLQGVADPYCMGAPEYRWQRTLDWDVAVRILGGRWPLIGELQNVQVTGADAFGRALAITLEGERLSVTISPAELRAALGPQYMRSSLLRSLEVTAQAPRRVIIEGDGRGHGVGMCQWGARQMALEGASARDILAFYFPGTTLGRLPFVP